MSVTSQTAHNALVVDQFTRQAVPFSRLASHTDDLLLSMTGVTAADTVLDVACGPGMVACLFAAHAAHVTGIDLTPAMIEQAGRLVEKRGLANVTLRTGDVRNLPFPDAAFSLVISRYAFHHFPDPATVLGEMVRVCRPGGRVMIADAALSPDKADAFNQMERLRDPSHARALTTSEWAELWEQAGFQNVRARPTRLELTLASLMSASFPGPDDREKVREIFRSNLETDTLGMDVHLRDAVIHLAYPVLIMVGQKAG
ncbi:MAG: class I SAM-dependent methyltransferase [Blastocatellia bacterium]